MKITFIHLHPGRLSRTPWKVGTVGKSYMGNLSLTVISGETLDNSISPSLTFPIYTMEQYELQNAPLLRELSSHSFLPGSSSPLCLTSSILGYSHASSSLSLKVTSERIYQSSLRSHSPPHLCLMDTIFDYLMSLYHFIHLFYFIFLSVCVCVSGGCCSASFIRL